MLNLVNKYTRWAWFFVLLLSFSASLGGLCTPQGLLAQGIKYSANNVELKPKDDKAILTGNAFVRKKNQGLKADKIIMDNKNNEAQAFGNVVFLNRSQGVYYKGDYVLYQTEKETILAKGNASIENRKQNTFMTADEFNVDMQKNLIHSVGNTQITADKGADRETFITGKKSIYNLDKNIIEIFEDVTILDKEKQTNSTKGNNKDAYVENYIIQCQSAKYIASESLLECKDDVRTQKPDADSFISSDFLRYDKKTGNGLAQGNAVFTQKSEDKNIINKAETMQLFSEEEKVVMSNNVVMYEETLQGEQLSTLSCDIATNYLGEKASLECRNNATLSRFIKDSTVKAGFFVYHYSNRIGFAKDEPIMVIKQSSNNDLHIRSPEMRYSADEGKMHFLEDVTITNFQTNEKNIVFTNQTIDCDSGAYNFNDSSEPFFQCSGHVVIKDSIEQTDIFSKRMTHLFSDETTYLTGSPNFIQKDDANHRIIKGRSKEIQLHRSKKYIDMLNKVIIEEFDEANQRVSKFSGDEFRYIYLNNKREFIGKDNILLEKPIERSYLRSEYLTYDANTEIALIETNALFVQENNERTKTISYADTIQVFSLEERSKLIGHVAITEIQSKDTVPRLFSKSDFSKKKYDYILCKNGEYFFTRSQEKFICIEDVQVFRPSERTVISGHILSHYFFKDYSELAAKPKEKALPQEEEKEGSETEDAEASPQNDDDEALASSDSATTTENTREKSPNELNTSLKTEIETEIQVESEEKIEKTDTQTIAAELSGEKVLESEINAEVKPKSEINAEVKPESEINAEIKPEINAEDLIINEQEFALDKELRTEYRQEGLKFTHTVHADVMELENAKSLSRFSGNVIMAETYPNGEARGNIYCEESSFSFKTPEAEIFRCQKDVKIYDYRDKTSVTGQGLYYDVAEEYSKVTGNPYFKWDSENGITEIYADIMEKFDKQNIMYAKGKVSVDNGKNKAYSSLGIYDVSNKKITLLGNPKIVDIASGDEFVATTVVFDLEANKMLLKSDIQGSISIEESEESDNNAQESDNAENPQESDKK